jgi:hypothetical protein
METQFTLDGITDPTLPHAEWAAATYARCALGDRRLARRVVELAATIARSPQVSLGRSCANPASLKAAYRLLQHPAATLETLSAPHRRASVAAARSGSEAVLLVQDTTEFDYTAHPATTGLGPIGDGRGRGFLVQSVLAVRPGATAARAMVLGVVHLQAFDRVPAPRPDETSAERRSRARESDVWVEAVAKVGSPPAAGRWVMVGDRGADIYRLFAACRAHGQDFLVRAVQDRRATDSAGEATHVVAHARGLAPHEHRRSVEVPAKPGQPARTAEVEIGWSPLRLRPPAGTTGADDLAIWVVRVWEHAPPAGATPLDWILLTSVPTETVEAVWERAEWYRHRWIIEEYHHALKTGCRLEASQLREQDRLWSLLGGCAPIAVRLLQLRMAARGDPSALATTVLDEQTITVVAALTKTSAIGMTLGTCWRMIARLGGHLGRNGDGEPGWKSIWWGWQRVQDTLDGVRLAQAMSAR